MLPVRFDRPIFILAPPRSGSTFLFDCLCQFADLLHLRDEADRIWWQVFPYFQDDAPSDLVGRKKATRRNIRAIRWLTYRAALRSSLHGLARYSRWVRYAHFLLGQRAIRYLDKTIANCFHLEFLEQAFPDAQFVFLVRDPRANISSMLESWPHSTLAGKPQLTEIVRRHPNATIDHWSFPAPPGWQSVLPRPLPEICAWTWQQHIEYVQQFFRQSRREKISVRYEELLEDRWPIVAEVAAKLGLEPKKDTREKVLEGAMSRTVISKPQPDKWKNRNYQEIQSILPMIKKTAASIGYEV